MALSEEYKKTVSDNPYMLQIGETPEQYNVRVEGLRSKPTNQPTIGSLGLDTGQSPYDQEIERLQNERFSNLNEPAPTREGVRKEITDMFQAQIDALNRAAAEEKARLSTRYAEIGKRRLGTERAQQSSTGMLGQVSGESAIRGVESDTAEELGTAQRAVDAALAEKLGVLSSEARRLELEEYNSRIQARQGTLQDKLNYYSNRATQALNRVNTLAQSALLQGVDLSSPENETYLNTYAKQIGVSPETLKTSYLTAKTAAEEENLKKESEKEKIEFERGIELEKLGQAREKIGLDYKLSQQKFEEDKRQFGLNYALNAKKLALEEAKEGTKSEKAQGANELKTSALQSAKDLLDKFISSKGTSAVGKSRMLTFGKTIPGSEARDFEIQFNNLKSLLSLDNVKHLKGQGQVSDAERRLLSEASSKLDLNQSEEEFKQALDDIYTALGGNVIEATFNFDKFNLPH